jgi:O-antigen ligase
MRRTASRRRASAAPHPAEVEGPVDPLYRLDWKPIWRFVKAQPAAFWLVCLYLFFEYVRIQEIYAPLKGLPIPLYTILFCGLAFLLGGAQFRKWQPIDTLLMVFSGVVILSSITAYSPAASFNEFSLFFDWVVIYFLITNIVNTERRFFIFMLLYLIYCMKMTQHGVRSWAEAGFGFIRIGVGCAPSWFQNSGECGIQMSMLFPVSLYFILALRIYWDRLKRWVMIIMLPFGSALTMMASSSRGAQLGFAGIGLWMVMRSKRKFRVLLAVVVLAPLLYAILPEQQKERFRTAGDDQTSQSRLTYWKDGLTILHEHPVLGIGYRNWLTYYRQRFNPVGELPHNIFIEASAEMGYLGFFSFVALIVATFVTNSRTRKRARLLPGSSGRFLGHMAFGFDGALIGYLITGFFVTVLYYPFFWINLAMTVALHNVTELRSGELRRAASQQRRVLLRGAPQHPALPPAPIARAEVEHGA